MFLSLLCTGVLAGLAAASDSSFRLMSLRIHRDSFVKIKKSESKKELEVVIAVQQHNLDTLERLLIERSTPGNELYRQWLGFDEITALSRNPTGTEEALKWLHANAVNVTWTSLRQDYIKATATIEVWERLLDTEFFQFVDTTRRTPSNEFHLADAYSIPAFLRPHIAAIFNTVQTPPEINPHLFERDPPEKSSFRTEISVSRRGNRIHLADNSPVTPAFLNSLYRIGSNNGTPAQSQSVFETNEQHFSPNDLTTFQQTYDLPLESAQAPYGYTTTDCVNNDCHEGNLDIQYIMGIAQHTTTIYWYTANTGATNPFVDWITAVSSDPDPPLINSVSWGSIEQANSVDTMEAFNTEAMKLALQGVTVLVSTGDNGVASRSDLCNTDSGSSQSAWTGASWTGEGYFPSFPATSPYVTAVGATMGPEDGDPEIACQSQLGGVITTGGGFSTYYAQPSWQTDAVNAYFAGLSAGEQPSSGYNPNGRGIPDVSLIGVNYQVVIQDSFKTLFGTSASAPVFGAMLSVINAERARSNLSSVGFINPTLYGYGMNNSFGEDGGNFNPFQDVTSGHNKCAAYTGSNPSNAVCCQSGFYAIAGWDPVTGWGSTGFPELAQMLAVEVNYTIPDGGDGGGNDSTLSLAVTIVIAVLGFALLVTLLACAASLLCAPCAASTAVSTASAV